MDSLRFSGNEKKKPKYGYHRFGWKGGINDRCDNLTPIIFPIGWGWPIFICKKAKIEILVFTISLVIADVLTSSTKSGGQMTRKPLVCLSEERGAVFGVISTKNVRTCGIDCSRPGCKRIRNPYRQPRRPGLRIVMGNRITVLFKLQ